MQFQTMSQLGDTLKGIVEISNGTVRVLDARRIRGPLIDRLTWTAVFHEKAEMRGMARWVIKMLAPSLGIHSDAAPALDAETRRAVPSIQITGMSYRAARAFFRAAVRHQGGAFVAGCPPSKQAHPSQYETTLTAAAIQEGFQGVLFFEEQRSANPCRVAIDTRFALSHEHHGDFVQVHAASDKALSLTVTVFVKETIPIEKQEVFLWRLRTDLHEKIAREIEEKLEAYFKNHDATRTAGQVQESLKPAKTSFTLRDEIAAALSESSTGEAEPFYRNLINLESESRDAGTRPFTDRSSSVS